MSRQPAIACLVGDDPEKPRSKRRPRPKAAERVVGVHEPLLRGIFRVGGVAGDLVGDPERQLLVLLDEYFICVYIAVPCAFDESYVVQWPALHGSICYPFIPVGEGAGSTRLGGGMPVAPPALSVSMSWRPLALAGGCLLTILAVGLWQERPWQHSAGSLQPTSCRLPVYLTTSNTGGFLTVPGYTFTEVPGNTFIQEAKSADGYWSYDAAAAKWLPVDHRMVSLDGNWWVYATPLASASMSASAALHMVDRHGTDRMVWTGTGMAYPLGWTAGGAVFVHVVATPHFHSDYWLVDPSTGTPRSVPPMPGETVGIDASGSWGIRNLLTGPASDTKAPEHWTLIRTDIRSAATVSWWDQTLPALVVATGFDGDQHPILRIVPFDSDRERYVLLTSPNTETEITGDARAMKFYPGSALGDSHGVWFGDLQGAVWLWNAGDGLQRVAQLPTHLTDFVADVAVIAGPCR